MMLPARNECQDLGLDTQDKAQIMRRQIMGLLNKLKQFFSLRKRKKATKLLYTVRNSGLENSLEQNVIRPAVCYYCCQKSRNHQGKKKSVKYYHEKN